jgi:hypothetical protein
MQDSGRSGGAGWECPAKTVRLLCSFLCHLPWASSELGPGLTDDMRREAGIPGSSQPAGEAEGSWDGPGLQYCWEKR